MNQNTNTLPKLLSSVVQGGLGNQLFIIAHLHHMSKKLSCPFVLQTKHFTGTNEHSKVNQFQKGHILENFAEMISNENVNWKTSLEDKFMNKNDLPLSEFTQFRGYFQHQEYIESEFVQLLKLRFFALQPNQAFLHIRGGDYLTSSLHCISLENLKLYLQNAIVQYAQDTHFVIHTNDVKYAREKVRIDDILDELGYNQSHAKQENDEETTLCEMVSSPRGGILANSSFSFWAAYLSHELLFDESKLFCVPEKWYNDHRFFVDGLYAPFFTKVKLIQFRSTRFTAGRCTSRRKALDWRLIMLKS